MPTKVLFEWYGGDIKKRIRAAERQAVVETAVACVRKAVPRAPIEYGTLRRSIKIGVPVEGERGVRILWGSFDVNYALYQERGTGMITGKFYLKRSADDEYPKFGERIKEAYA